MEKYYTFIEEDLLHSICKFLQTQQPNIHAIMLYDKLKNIECKSLNDMAKIAEEKLFKCFANNDKISQSARDIQIKQIHQYLYFLTEDNKNDKTVS